MSQERSHLLTLPRELRNLIYHHLLHSVTREPPTEAPELDQFQRFPSTTSWWGIHRFAPRECLPFIYGLLLTSKLIRAETLDAIALATATHCCVDPYSHWHGHSPSVRDPLYVALKEKYREDGLPHSHEGIISGLVSQPLVYELDVIMFSERLLLPTWTKLPAIPPNAHFPLLRVNFRIFGDRGGKESAWRSSSGYGGSLGDMYFALLDLLLTFLERGPDYRSPPKGFPYQKPITVGRLELSVETPSPERMNGNSFINDDSESRYGMISPEFVAEGVELGVHVVLGTAAYADAVVPRVGQVRLYVDTNQRYAWDVEEMRRRKVEDQVH